MEIITVIGLVAAVCTTSAWLPQIIKSYRFKATKDISIGLTILFLLGFILWLIYGVMKKDIVIILANTIAFIFSFFLLVLKLKYK